MKKYPFWAPKEGEWKPDMNWAAVDSIGTVFQYHYKPTLKQSSWNANGKCAAYKMIDPIKDWKKALVKRPDEW